jgi:hypothetical protein
VEPKGEAQIETPAFTSPEDELRYLRSRVAEIEQKKWDDGTPADAPAAASQVVHEYVNAPAPSQESRIMNDPGFEDAVGHLGSLSHREKMRELHKHLSEKGVLYAVKVSRELGIPHLEDDFHRVLVEYVHKGGVIRGLEKERALDRALHMNVFSVSLPPSLGAQSGGNKAEEIRALMSVMEQLYLGLLLSGGKEGGKDILFTFEIAQSNFSHAIEFFVGVPAHASDLFIKQALALFPTAKLELRHDDYNVFNEFGRAAGSYATVTNPLFERSGSSSSCVLPLRTSGYDEDPIKVLLNAFSHLERDGEGAAIQFVMAPGRHAFTEKLREGLSQLKKGKKKPKEALDLPLSAFSSISRSIGETLFAKDTKKDDKPPQLDEVVIKKVEEKLSKQIVMANLRIVASAGTDERTKSILNHIESAFHQFGDAQGGRLKFHHPDKARLERLIYSFTYRDRDDEELLYLNSAELAALYHFPTTIEAKSAPQLAQSSSTSAPVAAEALREGTLLGMNSYQGRETEVRMGALDRLRHLYVIGQTGTGKTSLLKNMIVEDIKHGDGVCFIDPHGTDVQDILAQIPKERLEDVIYFDPSHAQRPFGLNMLEYDVNDPQQKIFVVNELLSIFKKLYSSTPEAMGPAFEQYFRNATMLVMEDPESGNTILEISRVLADKQFRALKLSKCKNPIVVQFWREIAEKTSGEAGLANMTPYITNKFDVFLSNDIMRPIIAQEKSSFNFRDIMDNRKILLVNLAKGKLGDINANLIGLILVGKILMAALSRVDSYGKKLPPFYLYIDEFQNITTDSISAILSEARKYGLSLTVAHQFLAQIDEGIRSAVFGNVGNIATFRIGSEDAEFLEKQFAPTFSAKDIASLDNYHAYVKMLINGVPKAPFNLKTLPPAHGEPSQVENLKALSYLKYGQDRRAVDEIILAKYASASVLAQKPAAPAPTAR